MSFHLEKSVFRLDTRLVLQPFEDSTLLFRAGRFEFQILDLVDYYLLTQLDGHRSTLQVAANMAATYHVPPEDALAKTVALFDRLYSKGYIRIVGDYHSQEVFKMLPKYRRNPDVVIRESDENGALLFNPDTNEVELLNDTGFFIWDFCDQGRAIGEIADALKADFEIVQEEELESDIEEFINLMVDRGLVGTV